jgi:NADH:ubiquinone oxidoreductase subunit E
VPQQLPTRCIDREVAKYPADQKQSAVMAALAIAQDEQSAGCRPR